MAQKTKQFLSPVWTHLTDLTVEKAAGSYIWCTQGKKYLDFACGIGVTNTGHCHPRVVEAIQKQAATLLHGQINIVYHKPMLELVEELQPVVPKGLDTFFFSNSGAEAVEASVKLARHATKKQNVITFQGSFHGRTIGTMSLTNSKTIYRRNYGPLMSGVHVAPYAYCYRCPLSSSSSSSSCKEEDCCDEPLQQLELLLKRETAPEETAAVLVEPVLGEGGYTMPPVSFMRGLRRLCDKHGMLLIADEVQTGFARTGRYFGIEHFGEEARPDIMVFAKGVASGLPLSGIVARAELHKNWIPGTHGGTYGGNAVACAAAVATQRVIKEEGLVENSHKRGAQLRAALEGLKAKYPQIGDVRGPGCMIGLEFKDRVEHLRGGQTRENKDGVKYGFAGALTKNCAKHGLLLLSCGVHETIRFIPPLTIGDEEVALGIELFEKGLQETIQQHN
ncbi:Aminotransferase class III-fold pyridoxal phosphate-dependent enzyme [Balamuthia mandrillaris]